MLRPWGPRVRVRLSPKLRAQPQQSQEALGSQRPCSACCPLSHLFVPLNSCPWGLDSDLEGPLRGHRGCILRAGDQGQVGRGKSCLPLPLPCSQWEGRPGLQEGGGLGRVGHVLVYPWQMSKDLCEGIYCVCVCEREKERLCMYVCMVNGALSDGLRVSVGRLCVLCVCVCVCVCVNGRVSSL